MYEFTQPWFETDNRELWDSTLPVRYPDGIGRVLEVGSFEGASACYLLEHGARQIVCVDTWEGADEHPYPSIDMGDVYQRFTQNIAEAQLRTGGRVSVVRWASLRALSAMILSGEEQFDFAYIDGQHTAAAALTDGLLAFELLRPGGWMYFDDYNWFNMLYPGDPEKTPHLGVDAFCSVHATRIEAVDTGNQMHVRKLP